MDLLQEEIRILRLLKNGDATRSEIALLKLERQSPMITGLLAKRLIITRSHHVYAITGRGIEALGAVDV